MIPFQHVLHLHRMNEDMLMVTSLTQKKLLYIVVVVIVCRKGTDVL